ncbi:hypothetical protein NRP93_001127 [Clostridium botulinum]|nr:hypothetical protein [Clostridium botulinum]
MDGKVTEKVNDYLDKINDKKNLAVTRGTTGPAVAGSYNSKSGEISIHINHPKGELPEVIHPVVNERIKNMPPEVLNAYEHTLRAGSHAECNALNDSLIKEFKITNNIKGEVTQEMLDEQYDLLKNMDLSHIHISVQNVKVYKKFLPETGMPMPRCIHCQYITNGATINSKILEAEKQMMPRLEDLLNGK